MKMHRNLTCAILLLFSQTSFGQSGILSGKVQDEKAAAIPYVNVAVVRAADSSLMTGAVTDLHGKFYIKSPEKGRYYLKVSVIGYTSTSSTVFEISTLSFSKNFGTLILRQESGLLAEVTVEALRPKVVTKPDKIVVNVEGTAMAAGSTAFEVLEKSPGVWVDQDGNLQLNGKSGVKVTIDGRPIYLSAKEVQSMLEGMPAENIKNIEIITNPSAKYDAEGTAGILNINLRKNTLTGMNGSFYGAYQYMQLQGYSAGGNLNYKKGNWNSFLNMDIAERPYYRDTKMLRQFNEETYTTSIEQKGRNEIHRFIPGLTIGTDYALNKKHYIGTVANLSYQNSYRTWETNSVVTETDGSKNFYLDAANKKEKEFISGTFNLHYQGKLDTVGTRISADLDYVKMRSQSQSGFLNKYHFLSGSKTTTFFNTDEPASFDIYSGRLDFVSVFAKGNKLELGLKGSRVLSQMEIGFFNNAAGESALIDSMSNAFRYEEGIYAAYANLTWLFNDRWNIQAGVRSEKTYAYGVAESVKEETEYLKFFPSLFIKQKISKNYQLSYSYSKRITRPNYMYMNPSVFYLDPYTFVKGNPFIRPQYTQAFQFTHTLNQTYNLILAYDYTTDFIAEVPEQDPKTNQTFFSPGNVDSFENFSATIVAPIEMLPMWSVSNNLLAAYHHFDTHLQNAVVENKRFFLHLQSDHTVKLPKQIKLEVNAFYRSPIAYGVYRLRSIWGANAAIKRSFWQDKLDLTLNVTDVFRSVYVTGNANIQGNINSFDHYTGKRGFKINLRCRFSTGEKFERKQRARQIDEIKRVGEN